MHNNYDRINVSNYRVKMTNKYLCSMCGQYTTLEESISYKGFNLICRRCEAKVKHLFGINNTLELIHKKGQEKEEHYEEELKQFKYCYGVLIDDADVI